MLKNNRKWITSLSITVTCIVGATTVANATSASDHHVKKVAAQLYKERAQAKKEIANLKSQLRRKYKPMALEAIKFGSIVTGYPYRQGVALVRCETGGTFSPFARNSTALSGSNATGLWQWLYHPHGIRSSTWHHESRYSEFSPYNPYIQSVASGEHWKKYGRSWYRGWLDICGTIADRS
jgi:hypothetical protein